MTSGVVCSLRGQNDLWGSFLGGENVDQNGKNRSFSGYA